MVLEDEGRGMMALNWIFIKKVKIGILGNYTTNIYGMYSRILTKIPLFIKEIQIAEAYSSNTQCSRIKVTWKKNA